MTVTTPAASAAQLPQEAQTKLLVTLCIALLNQKGQETEDKLLLRELCIERHTREQHEKEFITCDNEACQTAINIMAASMLEEATFKIADMDKLKNINLKYGGLGIGTVRAWLEDAPVLII